MFPGPGANIYRNEAGEPLGWDYPSDEPYEEDYEEADRRYEAMTCDLCGLHPDDCDRCPRCDTHLNDYGEDCEICAIRLNADLIRQRFLKRGEADAES